MFFSLVKAFFGNLKEIMHYYTWMWVWDYLQCVYSIHTLFVYFNFNGLGFFLMIRSWCILWLCSNNWCHMLQLKVLWVPLPTLYCWFCPSVDWSLRWWALQSHPRYNRSPRSEFTECCIVFAYCVVSSFPSIWTSSLPWQSLKVLYSWSARPGLIHVDIHGW